MYSNQSQGDPPESPQLQGGDLYGSQQNSARALSTQSHRNSVHSDHWSEPQNRSPSGPADAPEYDPLDMTFITADGRRQKEAPRESAQDTLHKAGLGNRDPIVALDTKLAQSIMLFWTDFSENDVPIRRRTELVKEAMVATFYARSARNLPMGSPDDEVYIKSVMRRLSLVVTFYNHEKYKRNNRHNTPGLGASVEAPATPINYLENIRQAIEESKVQSLSPVDGATELNFQVTDEVASRGTRMSQPIAGKILRDAHEIGRQLQDEREHQKTYEELEEILKSDDQSENSRKTGEHDTPTRKILSQLAQQYKVGDAAIIGIANDLKDRIVLQRIHNDDMAKWGKSNYSDQGIRWESDGNITDLMRLQFETRSRYRQTVPEKSVDNSLGLEFNTHDKKSEDELAAERGAADHAAQQKAAEEERLRRIEKNKELQWAANEAAKAAAKMGPRGFRAISHPPTSLGRNAASPAIKDVQDRYRLDMHERLKEIIRDNCGTKKIFGGDKDRPKPPDIKTVPTYKGEDRMRDLETWVTDVSIYFALANLSGPDKEDARVMYSEMLLEGKAKNFVRLHVFGLNREKRHWTFEEVATALYDRFVMASVTQDARTIFEKARYEADTGIQGLYDTICDISETMIDRPDRYTLADRFIRGIPANWRNELFNRNFTPEMNSIEELVSEAKSIEAAEKVARHYDRNLPHGVHTNLYNSRAIARDRVERSGRDGRDRRARRTRNDKSSTEAVDRRVSDKSALEPPRREDGDRRKPGESYQRPNGTKPEGKRHPRPLSEVKCFACGMFGHYKPDCPNSKGENKRREYVRAAHTHTGSRMPDDSEDSTRESSSDSDTESRSGYCSTERGSADGEVDVPYDDFDSEFYSRTSDTERIYAMREVEVVAEVPYAMEENYETPGPEVIAAMTAVISEIDNSTKMIKRRTGTFKAFSTARIRPVVPPAKKSCLVTYTNANGEDAWTLWDAGSTTTSITPAFADVAKITAFPLLDPFVVQLGTVGSRAKITHGANVPIDMPGCKGDVYADICNLDRYDMVVGTPFMHENGVVLDFARLTVTVNGVVTPALPYPADADARLHRSRANDHRAD